MGALVGHGMSHSLSGGAFEQFMGLSGCLWGAVGRLEGEFGADFGVSGLLLERLWGAFCGLQGGHRFSHQVESTIVAHV